MSATRHPNLSSFRQYELRNNSLSSLILFLRTVLNGIPNSLDIESVDTLPSEERSCLRTFLSSSESKSRSALGFPELIADWPRLFFLRACRGTARTLPCRCPRGAVTWTFGVPGSSRGLNASGSRDTLLEKPILEFWTAGLSAMNTDGSDDLLLIVSSALKVVKWCSKVF